MVPTMLVSVEREVGVGGRRSLWRGGGIEWNTV